MIRDSDFDFPVVRKESSASEKSYDSMSASESEYNVRHGTLHVPD